VVRLESTVKKVTIFKLGLSLSFIGIIWIALIFSESEKNFQNYDIDVKQTELFDITLQKEGIGFYKIEIPDFADNSLFVQVLDNTGNVISDEKIETRMSVNYFDFEYGGVYTIKITNISDKPVKIEIEYGNTNAFELRNPGIILLIGQILIIVAAFRKLKNYRMAQPEEKIS